MRSFSLSRPPLLDLRTSRRSACSVAVGGRALRPSGLCTSAPLWLSPNRRSTVGRPPGLGSERGRPSSRARDHLMRWRRLSGVVKHRRIADPARRPDGALGGTQDVTDVSEHRTALLRWRTRPRLDRTSSSRAPRVRRHGWLRRHEARMSCRQNGAGNLKCRHDVERCLAISPHKLVLSFGCAGKGLSGAGCHCFYLALLIVCRAFAHVCSIIQSSKRICHVIPVDSTFATPVCHRQFGIR
jgi:hypothetical protein